MYILDNKIIIQLVENKISIDAHSRNVVLFYAMICLICFEDGIFLRFEIWW